ncbi:MAG TPA: tripartite tricarboxylate transporter substrate binding protein [bacterium]|nr:tripartite tricarboxylate transporter substrate binding protein [bacterium]
MRTSLFNGKALLRGLVLALSATMLFAGSALADWTPRKPIEFVIMAGTGGGADRLARLIQSIIQKNHYSPQPFIPINKGGGSGAEALRYLVDHKGDPYVVMATLNSYYTTPLRDPALGVDIKEFTPIARLALDTFVLWVNADTNIHTLNDYVKAVKAANGQWKMGGTGTGQEDSLVTGMLESEFGLKYTYIPYKGGGTVAKNLAGDHVNSTVNNPSEAIGFYEAKKVRPIASFTPNRIDVLKSVPTMKELGHNLQYFMQRSVVGPPGMPKDVEAFYVNVFRKVNDSTEWKQYCEKHALDRAFLTGDALQQFFLAERDHHRKLLKEMGEIH